MTLRSDNNGSVVFGEKFCAYQNFSVFTNTKITFGDNCVLGWNVNVRDSDGQPIKDASGNLINPNKQIYIGDINISNIKMGNSPITKVYIGDSLIWEV